MDGKLLYLLLYGADGMILYCAGGSGHNSISVRFEKKQGINDPVYALLKFYAN